MNPGALELHHVHAGAAVAQVAVPAEVDEHDVALADRGAAVGRDAHEVVEVEQVARLPVAVGDVDDHRAAPQGGHVERVHGRLGALGHHVRGRIDVRADVLGQDQRLQAVLVALDEAGVVDDVELGVREEARHRRAQRRRQVDGLEAVQGSDERIHRSDRRIRRRGHVLSSWDAYGSREAKRGALQVSPTRAARSAGRRGIMAPHGGHHR